MCTSKSVVIWIVSRSIFQDCLQHGFWRAVSKFSNRLTGWGGFWRAVSKFSNRLTGWGEVAFGELFQNFQTDLQDGAANLRLPKRQLYFVIFDPPGLPFWQAPCHFDMSNRQGEAAILTLAQDLLLPIWQAGLPF
jgi:hypothetical protein